MLEKFIEAAFSRALEEASRNAGRTSPNPCVGAAALDGQGNLLTVLAHERAGEPHAEARVIQELEKTGQLTRAHTLLVTLEPCNHFGRTPPCTEAILRAGFRRVFFGATDPNPRVQGRGAEKLRSAGVEVNGPEEILSLDPSSRIPGSCQELIRTFSHWSRTGAPWVTIKTAINLEGTMFPRVGQKTFTSPESLKLAHELRRRADAILTGSGTILADQPLFTVRHLPDHPGKSRWLAVLDRRGRIPESYYSEAARKGFQVHRGQDLSETLHFLGERGVLEVLVEAGPTLSQSILQSGIWNQHVLIQQEPGAADIVEVRLNRL